MADGATGGNGMVSRQAITDRLQAQHAGEESVYTGCYMNCGGGHCVLKVRRRNGVITAIEPDDHYNRGVGREDAVVSDEDLVKNRLQLRACPMAWMFHKLTTTPDRILYPLKRVEGSKRMEGKYERISWDEALDLVASKLKEAVEKYGPYSIMTGYSHSPRWERLFRLWGAGVEGWGSCSWDAGQLAGHLMAGVPAWSYDETSNDMADVLFNTKLIVLWGFEPTVQHYGAGHQVAYFIELARERGIPVICIEARYTVAAEVLADQWIPIKPGTDTAMMLAVADVVLREGLYDREFVEAYVDEVGFEEWRDYILGESDGVEKTPEWAEGICGVPAETIRGFARLYAEKSSTWLWLGYGPPRKSRGENVVRAAAGLQAIMGYWGVAGGSVPFDMGTHPKPGRGRGRPYGDVPVLRPPAMYRTHQWAQVVLLLDKVNSGEMSAEEYKRRVGWRAPDNLPLPNPKVLVSGGPYFHSTRMLNNAAMATADNLKAIERMDFIVYTHSHLSPAIWCADVILPVADQCLEDRRMWGGGTPGSGGFANITYVAGAAEPPGETRPGDWIMTQIARRLGVGDEYNRLWRDGEDWDEFWERYLHAEYDHLAEGLRKNGATAPTWEEFKREGVINVDELHDVPYHGYRAFVEEGVPLRTQTGKIELFNYVLADEDGRDRPHVDGYGRLIEDLPNDWRDLPPIPAYQQMYRGMDHPDVARFPLMLLSSYPRYRNHSAFWNVPWLKGDCYRHACWLSVADAQARGVRDGDLVRVFNDKGIGVIPAYVTSRLLPGVVVIKHGGWYEPDADGVDWGCTPNLFLTDPESPVTVPHVTNLVQVEKYSGPGPARAVPPRAERR